MVYVGGGGSEACMRGGKRANKEREKEARGPAAGGDWHGSCYITKRLTDCLIWAFARPASLQDAGVLS